MPGIRSNESADSMSSGAVDEFHREGNNLIARPLHVPSVSTPDLQVTDITIPERSVQGQAVELTYTVSNLGGDVPPSQVNWNDLVYLSRDPFLDPRVDRYLTSVPHAGILPSGESYSTTTTVTLPRDILGPYYLCVVTDPLRDTPFGGVFELAAETNNDRASDEPLIIEVPPPADLQISNMQIPSAVTSGEPFVWSGPWQMRANMPANGTWQDAVYLSADATWDLSDPLVGRVRFQGTLAPGESYDAELETLVPPAIVRSLPFDRPDGSVRPDC